MSHPKTAPNRPYPSSRGLYRRLIHLPTAAALVFLTVLATTAPAAARVRSCPMGDRRAATLLFPYFEVDLDGGKTTLISITNATTQTFPPSSAPELVRVTLWTDWGIPTMSFNLYLKAFDVQTFNLRDLLQTGQAPVTGPGASAFPGCGDTVGGATVWSPAVLQAAHTGRMANGGCWSSPHTDTNVATGYVTADVIARCGTPATTPATPGYFTGTNRVASNDNALMGDFFIVDPDQNYAGGQGAVHIVANPEFGAGEATFYGKFVGGSGADKRAPLSKSWATRFITGGGFDGGTHLLVWRDTPTRSGGYSCTTGPSWAPLTTTGAEIADEDGHNRLLPATETFGVATQRVSVTTAVAPSYPFGFLRLYLGDQGWVGWDANAESRFNVSLAGVPLTDPCFSFF